jgi:hypothetical protein
MPGKRKNQQHSMTDLKKDIPELIYFTQSGEPHLGFLVSTQRADWLPFPVKRVFWVHHVPGGVRRGQHAGKDMAEVVVAVQGRVDVYTECRAGRQHFVLDRPDVGLYVPPKCWIELSFSADALLVCLASTDYEEQDYIADYTEFQHTCLLSPR